MNEQNIFTSLGYLLAAHPPGVTDPKRMYEVNHIANLANASVINKFHELEMPGKIGPSFAYTPNYPIDSNPENVLAAENAVRPDGQLLDGCLYVGKISDCRHEGS